MNDLRRDLEERNKLVAKAVENRASRAALNRILELRETADFVNADELRRVLGVVVHGEHPHGWE